MTETLTTPREIRSPHNGKVPNLDSPGMSTRARARLTNTDRDGNRKIRRIPRPAELVRRWWAWTAQPASLAATWTASKVDRRRVPANNPVLYRAWQVSNWTDRLIMFALILALPTALTGLLRWCAPRPTRRYGLYLTTAVLTALLAL